MPAQDIDTVVVGGGQAGIAIATHLGRLGVESVVLEKSRIAEAWRTGRWDSLVANGPAWHDRFPDKVFAGIDDDAFPGKDDYARYFEEFAAEQGVDVRTGTEVLEARPEEGGGFTVRSSGGDWRARNLVAATGPFQVPVIPPVVPWDAPGDAPGDAPVMQMHSQGYRNPAQLPPGGVLVVGAGSSGAQIADELLRAGRDVYLAVGPHDRPPRRYRGKDFCYWLGVLGKWTMRTPPAGHEHVTIAVSGAHGGHTVDFRDFADRGMTLLGMAEGHDSGVMRFRDDLARNIAQGDANMLALMDEADAYVAARGLDLPPEPEARQIGPLPAAATDPILSLDLRDRGIGTILWATGYRQDFGWLKADTFDDQGRPLHDKGVSRVPGLYFLGLPWLSMRGSSFVWGVYVDAERLAGHIAARRG